ncbi:hypothetical protein HG536_0C03800 [Torulaspora globosa]|uniref:Cullin family profile domain-containing protein n=1 Tax=Torulaspora globosa TaxID=48254 RepID=A0A7G3ZFC5_9SACH|nr:uncharacterized protein HG536_0C03800 [Torulaspora globosa]QLL32211.1 hypothetical protein HG536_0C03800 [Torulaspora globosa]
MASKRTKIRIPNRLGNFEESAESLLSSLGQAIDEICLEHYPRLSFEHLYRLVYTLTLRKKGPEVFEVVELHIGKILDQRRKDLEYYKGKGYELLDALCVEWEKECVHFKLLSDVMIYMDKVYCKQEMKPETYDFAMRLFKERIVLPLSASIDEAMIQEFNNIRLKQSLDGPNAHLCKELVGIMETLAEEKDNYFVNHFEPLLLAETEKYYQSVLKNKNLDSVARLEYMKKLRNFEYELDSKVLNNDSTIKIIAMLDKVLLWNPDFLNDKPTLVRLAIDTNGIELMKELCQLSDDSEYAKRLTEAVKKCLRDDANSLNLDMNSKKRTQAAAKWTASLIELYDRYDRFLREVGFSPDILDPESSKDPYHSAGLLDNVFSEFLNQQGKQATDAITLYLDVLLKMTQPKREIERVKNDLEASVKLFKLLSEKDLFVNAYKQQMSRRLLQHRSMIEVERWMVKRIKDELGVFFTSKLDGMLRDIGVSNEISRAFKNSIDEDRWPNALDFRPQVLTVTSWSFQAPSASENDIILPIQLEQLKLDFESYYAKKYSERTLQWAHNLGYIELGLQFDESYHDISMPIPAAVICLLFDKFDQLTLEMMEEQTRIPEQELLKHLVSLTLVPKSRILRKKPSSRSISRNDKFTINYSFTAPTRKVKVQPVASILPPSRSDSNVDLVQDSLKRERLNETNAAIVRLLKSHQRLSHNDLASLVAEEVKNRFPMSSSLFKKSMNYLMEKEYVQRDPENLSIYHYIS